MKSRAPMNLGNPNEFSILELAKMIIEISGSQSKIIFIDLPSDDPKQRRPDITMAQEILKWEPQINLVNGLEKTIEYFRKSLS